MAKPSKQQSDQLGKLRVLVVEIMKDMAIWQNFDLDLLYEIPLAVLKRNATQRHGATKWQRGISREQLGLEFVEVIELHPELLSGDWNAYAAFVLHHEFIHALGFHNHDAEFRHLEYSWPGVEAGIIGPEFTEYLRRKSAKWLWTCSTCSKSFPRKNPSKGKYRCRNCSTILTDVQT